MSIWQYDFNRLSGKLLTKDGLVTFWSDVRHASNCAYCGEPMGMLERWTSSSATLWHEYRRVIEADRDKNSKWSTKGHKDHLSEQQRHYHSQPIERAASACPICGWWIAYDEKLELRQLSIAHYVSGGVGGLRAFDLTDVSQPVEDIRNFLAAKYDSRFQVHPRLFEETVASVFKDLGYEARVTGYSGDDGIDVILDGPDDQTIGVQVKRYRHTIQVSQLRELTGALVINGLTQGIFVTTSEFQAGAERTAKMSEAYGYPIKLYNAGRFYEALKLAQREKYRRADEPDAPFMRGPLRLIYTKVVDK